jgi:lipopolysaccharide cholinephosphotransferase
MHSILRKHDFDQYKYVGNLMGMYGIREIVRREVFGEPRLYSFEGYMFYGPEDYDAYLKHIYGNYMEMPPVEKQIPNHSFKFVDLELPYEEYDGEYKS